MPHRRSFVPPLSRCVLAGVALALVSCSGDLTLPNEGEPAHLAVVKGDGQNGTAGAALADSVAVRVTDARDRPVAGVAVAFVVQGTTGGTLLPNDTMRTDADGRAAVQWVLGDATGAQRLQARVKSGATVLTADLSATAGAGKATTLTLVRGDRQSATAGSTLPDSLVVAATDAGGLPVRGVLVSWSLTGGGSVSAEQTTTGADGRTGVVRVLGTTVGSQTTVASADGLDGSPVTFTATAQAGQAGRLTITTQPSSSATSGAAFATAPVVQLRDANGNKVATSGVAVTATIASGPGGAQLVGQSTRGTVSGVATFSGLGIQGQAGNYTLEFGGAGLVGVTSDPITIGGGAAARLVIVSQPGPSGAVESGVPFPAQPAVRLVDASGNTVSQAGVTVTAALTGANAASGTLGGDRTKSTDASGVATFTDLSISGPPANYTILFAATGLVSATSQAVGVGLGPSTTQVAAAKTTTVVGESYAVQVSVSGSGSTPTGKVDVSDQAGATCTATLSGGSGSCTLKSSAAGTRNLVASYGGDGQHSGSTGTQGHTVARAATTTTITATPDPSTAGAAVTVQVQVAAVAPGSGTPTGTVSVSGGGDTCGPITLSGGAGSCTLNPTASGAITATYAGDANFAGSAGTEPHAVNAIATTTQIRSSDPDPSDVNQAYVVKVRVTAVFGTPAGTVQVSDGAAGCDAPLDASGNGQCTLASTTSGTKTLTATYPGGGSFAGSSTTATHTVNAPNQAPTAANDGPYAVDAGTTLTVGAAQGVLANDADPDGDPITAVLANGPAHGTLSLAADGGFTYIPAAGYSGSDAFTYVARDSRGATSAPATVTITVNPVLPVNQAPTAKDDNYQRPAGAGLAVDAAGGVLKNDSDPDDDPLHAVLETPPTLGTIVLNDDGSFTYTPNDPSSTDADSFTYRASDGSLTSAPATVTIGVQSTTP